MAKHFSPEEDEDLVPERTKTQEQKQRLLLLLLLLLLLVFGYLYFFTGLIRPRPQAAPAQKTAGEAVVKKPLPPRVAEKGAEAPAEGKPAPAGEEAKAPGAQAKPGQPAAPPKTAPAEKGAPVAPAGPAKGSAHEAKAPKAGAPEGKAAKASPAETKGGKPAAEAKGGKPAAEAKGGKPAAEAKTAKAAEAKHAKAAPAQEAKGVKAAPEKAKAAAGKKAAAKGAAEAPAQKEAAAETGKAAPAKTKAKAAPAYVLEIKGDLAESEIGPVTTKLKKAGVATGVEKVKSHKTAPMHRLYLADFGNRDEALEELERLKLAAPEAFMLKENGRYTIYAGSYMRQSKAQAEQDRLYQKGVKLLMKSATVPVSVVKMRAGSFADKGSAAKAAERLKKAGVEASVVKAGK